MHQLATDSLPASPAERSFAGSHAEGQHAVDAFEIRVGQLIFSAPTAIAVSPEGGGVKLDPMKA